MHIQNKDVVFGISEEVGSKIVAQSRRINQKTLVLVLPGFCLTYRFHSAQLQLNSVPTKKRGECQL